MISIRLIDWLITTKSYRLGTKQSKAPNAISLNPKLEVERKRRRDHSDKILCSNPNSSFTGRCLQHPPNLWSWWKRIQRVVITKPSQKELPMPAKNNATWKMRLWKDREKSKRKRECKWSWEESNKRLTVRIVRRRREKKEKLGKKGFRAIQCCSRYASRENARQRWEKANRSLGEDCAEMHNRDKKEAT